MERFILPSARRNGSFFHRLCPEGGDKAPCLTREDRGNIAQSREETNFPGGSTRPKRCKVARPRSMGGTLRLLKVPRLGSHGGRANRNCHYLDASQ
jgi:hypothetical protein